VFALWEVNVTAEQLAMVAGVILSLAFSYIPGVSDWYAQRDGTEKRLIMAGLLLAVAAGAFGLSCAQVLSTVTCTRDGALGLVYAFIAALVANQTAYSISPRLRQAQPGQ
jgi:hypothetical protein